MPGASTPQLLNYASIVDVDLDQTNDVNLADVEDYGHRVVIEMDKTAMNNYLGWERVAGAARPSAKLDASKEAAFVSALEAALGAGFVDIDGVTGGLHFGSSVLSTNTDPRIRKDGAISANDIPLCFILYKLYGSSAAQTLDTIYNLEDAYEMLGNTSVASAITNSFKASEGGSLDRMFRDLLAADPHRFFDSAGIPDAGIFETRTDATGSGQWKIVANDTLEVKTKLIFKSKVSRRGVAGREHLLSDSNSGENQQTVIAPEDYFYIRLQIKAVESSGGGGGGGGGGGVVATAPAAPTGLTATATNNSITISFTAGSDGGSAITNYYYSLNNSSNYGYTLEAQTSSPVTIPFLNSGTSYTIRLKAINAIGQSEPSEPITISTTGTGYPLEANGTGDFDTWPVTSTPLTFTRALSFTPTRPAAGAVADYMGISVNWGTATTPYGVINNEELRNLMIVSPEDPADNDGDNIINETMATALELFPAGSLTGKAVLIQRGLTQFSFKAYAAQEAGAKLVIIYNSNMFGDQVIDMGVGTLAENVYIPVVMIGNGMGHRLVKQVRAGTTLYAKYKYSDVNTNYDRFFVYANTADEPDIGSSPVVTGALAPTNLQASIVNGDIQVTFSQASTSSLLYSYEINGGEGTYFTPELNSSPAIFANSSFNFQEGTSYTIKLRSWLVSDLGTYSDYSAPVTITYTTGSGSGSGGGGAPVSEIFKLIPNTNPDGSALTNPGVDTTGGDRYFRFTFTPQTNRLSFYLKTNQYAADPTDDEKILRIYKAGTTYNIIDAVNVTDPNGVIVTGSLTIKVTGNMSMNNLAFHLNNLEVGQTYSIVTKTLWNDSDAAGGYGEDIEAKVQESNGSYNVFTYVETSTTDIVPV